MNSTIRNGYRLTQKQLEKWLPHIERLRQECGGENLKEHIFKEAMDESSPLHDIIPSWNKDDVFYQACIARIGYVLDAVESIQVINGEEMTVKTYFSSHQDEPGKIITVAQLVESPNEFREQIVSATKFIEGKKNQLRGLIKMRQAKGLPVGSLFAAINSLEKAIKELQDAEWLDVRGSRVPLRPTPEVPTAFV